MTTTRLAAIQRDLGLHPTVVGKPGRPGAFDPVVVAGHWTAVRSSAGNPHPSLAVVRDGRSGLPGPLYGDLIPYQTDPSRLKVIQISVGRSNNLGMCHRPSVLAAGRGQTIARRPPADTAGGNDLVDAVSADYHPAQGPPPAAMVEAMVRAIAARLIYRGLPAHAVIDHAQATARKVDLLDHWPQPAELRARVAAAMTPSQPTPSEEDDMKPFLAQAVKEDGRKTPVYLVTAARTMPVPDIKELKVLQRLYGEKVEEVSVGFLRLNGAQV